MRICPSCKLPHDGMTSCFKAKLIANRVVNTVPEVVNTEPTVANESRHGKYADPEKRKAYMREYMRKRRGNSVSSGN